MPVSHFLLAALGPLWAPPAALTSLTTLMTSLTDLSWLTPVYTVWRLVAVTTVLAASVTLIDWLRSGITAFQAARLTSPIPAAAAAHPAVHHAAGPPRSARLRRAVTLRWLGRSHAYAVQAPGTVAAAASGTAPGTDANEAGTLRRVASLLRWCLPGGVTLTLTLGSYESAVLYEHICEAKATDDPAAAPHPRSSLFSGASGPLWVALTGGRNERTSLVTRSGRPPRLPVPVRLPRRVLRARLVVGGAGPPPAPAPELSSSAPPGPDAAAAADSAQAPVADAMAEPEIVAAEEDEEDERDEESTQVDVTDAFNAMRASFVEALVTPHLTAREIVALLYASARNNARRGGPRASAAPDPERARLFLTLGDMSEEEFTGETPVVLKA